MTKSKQTSTIVLGAGGAKPDYDGSKVSTETKDRIETMTPLEQDRYFAICDIFGEQSFEVIKYFQGKQVPFQWKTFCDNVQLVNNADDPMHAYFKALYLSASVKVPIRIYDAIGTVQSIRAKHSLDRFTTAIRARCKAELAKVFLLEETNVPASAEEKAHTGYVPVLSVFFEKDS